jgi:hypothetical protein
MSFPRHTKIYQSDEPEGGRTNGSTSLGDHRSDESSVGYSFVGCSPAEPASASPTATSLSQHPAAVNCSAAKRNLSPFSLSHLRGPLQVVVFKRPFNPILAHAIGMRGNTECYISSGGLVLVLFEVRKRSRDIFDNLRPLWGEREFSRRLASRSCQRASYNFVISCSKPSAIGVLSAMAVQAHEKEEAVRPSVFRFAIGKFGAAVQTSSVCRAGVSVVPLCQCLRGERSEPGSPPCSWPAPRLRHGGSQLLGVERRPGLSRTTTPSPCPPRSTMSRRSAPLWSTLLAITQSARPP